MKAKRPKNIDHGSPRAETSHPDQQREQCDVGAPIEHYRGERPLQGTTGDEGDLELETLDADAPYNKTYGR